MIEDIITKAGTKMKAGAGMVHDKSGLLDFVTDKDVQIQEYLMSEILKVYPNAHFFSGKKTDMKDYILSGHTFFIDPNDDTTNYTSGYQHRCISVGETVDGKPIVGGFIIPSKIRCGVPGEGKEPG